jgi:Na+/melibiose symporter-like transporter
MAKTKKQEEKKEELGIHLQVAKQMVTLATNGFGLVAALAWNNVIQELVNTYLKKWLPGGSGALSLLIYAVIVTILAVAVTTNLSKTVTRLERLKTTS